MIFVVFLNIFQGYTFQRFLCYKLTIWMIFPPQQSVFYTRSNCRYGFVFVFQPFDCVVLFFFKLILCKQRVQCTFCHQFQNTIEYFDKPEAEAPEFQKRMLAPKKSISSLN